MGRDYSYKHVTFGENGKFANKTVQLKGWCWFRDGDRACGGILLPTPQNKEKPTFYFNLDKHCYQEAIWWVFSKDEVKALFLDIKEGKSIYRILGEGETRAQFPDIMAESIYGILSDDEDETHLLGIIGKSVCSVDSKGDKIFIGGYGLENYYLCRVLCVDRENQVLGIRNKATIQELHDLLISESKNDKFDYYLEHTWGYYGL